MTGHQQGEKKINLLAHIYCTRRTSVDSFRGWCQCRVRSSGRSSTSVLRLLQIRQLFLVINFLPMVSAKKKKKLISGSSSNTGVIQTSRCDGKLFEEKVRAGWQGPNSASFRWHRRAPWLVAQHSPSPPIDQLSNLKALSGSCCHSPVISCKFSPLCQATREHWWSHLQSNPSARICYTWTLASLLPVCPRRVATAWSHCQV